MTQYGDTCDVILIITLLNIHHLIALVVWMCKLDILTIISLHEKPRVLCVLELGIFFIVHIGLDIVFQSSYQTIPNKDKSYW